MRASLVFIFIFFCFGFSAFADYEKRSDIDTCSKLEDVVSDLQGRLFAAEASMKMETYPSCRPEGRISPTLDKYCALESSLSFILQSYIDQCE